MIITIFLSFFLTIYILVIRKLVVSQVAELLGKRWQILEELYNGELSSKELANRLKKPLPWISNQLKELRDEEAGLVSFKKENRRIKVYSLTEKGRSLCSAVMEASRSGERVKVPVETLNLRIKALEDRGLPPEIRRAAAHGLMESCSPDKEIVGERGRLRDFFVDAMIRMGEYVSAKLIQVYIALGYYISNQLTAEEFSWLRGSCYPKAKLAFEKPNTDVKLSALEVLSHIYQRCGKESEMGDLADELSKVFEAAFLSPQEDEPIAKRCWEILRMHGGELDEFMDKVFREAKSKTNDERVRDRCQQYFVKALESAPRSSMS